jgi:cbb3-type cytochrome oxidase subunit 1
MLLGLGVFMVVLTAAGLIQGAGWINGEEVYRVLPEIHLDMVLRAWGGIFVVAAAYMMLYNVLMTLRGAPLDREPEEPAMHLRDVEHAEA